MSEICTFMKKRVYFSNRNLNLIFHDLLGYVRLTFIAFPV